MAQQFASPYAPPGAHYPAQAMYMPPAVGPVAPSWPAPQVWGPPPVPQPQPQLQPPPAPGPTFAYWTKEVAEAYEKSISYEVVGFHDIVPGTTVNAHFSLFGQYVVLMLEDCSFSLKLFTEFEGKKKKKPSLGFSTLMPEWAERIIRAIENALITRLEMVESERGKLTGLARQDIRNKFNSIIKLKPRTNRKEGESENLPVYLNASVDLIGDEHVKIKITDTNGTPYSRVSDIPEKPRAKTACVSLFDYYNKGVPKISPKLTTLTMVPVLIAGDAPTAEQVRAQHAHVLGAGFHPGPQPSLPSLQSLQSLQSLPSLPQPHPQYHQPNFQQSLQPPPQYHVQYQQQPQQQPPPPPPQPQPAPQPSQYAGPQDAPQGPSQSATQNHAPDVPQSDDTELEQANKRHKSDDGSAAKIFLA